MYTHFSMLSYCVILVSRFWVISRTYEWRQNGYEEVISVVTTTNIKNRKQQHPLSYWLKTCTLRMSDRSKQYKTRRCGIDNETTIHRRNTTQSSLTLYSGVEEKNIWTNCKHLLEIVRLVIIFTKHHITTYNYFFLSR